MPGRPQCPGPALGLCGVCLSCSEELESGALCQAGPGPQPHCEPHRKGTATLRAIRGVTWPSHLLRPPDAKTALLQTGARAGSAAGSAPIANPHPPRLLPLVTGIPLSSSAPIGDSLPGPEVQSTQGLGRANSRKAEDRPGGSPLLSDIAVPYALPSGLQFRALPLVCLFSSTLIFSAGRSCTHSSLGPQCRALCLATAELHRRWRNG